MKCLGYIDPAYAAYAPYPYGDYSSAYASLDPYAYGGYYGCYDYFGAAANPSTATGGYGESTLPDEVARLLLDMYHLLISYFRSPSSLVDSIQIASGFSWFYFTFQ